MLKTIARAVKWAVGLYLAVIGLAIIIIGIAALVRAVR